MTKIEGLFKFLDYLSDGGIKSVDYLAKELEVTPRTIARWRDDLQAIGYHIEVKTGPQGGYTLIRDKDSVLNDLNQEEIIHIVMALTNVLQGDTMLYTPEQIDALYRLVHTLSLKENVVHIDTINSKTVLIEDEEAYFKHLNVLKEAVKNHQRIIIHYINSQNEAKDYRFEPYELFIVNKVWYVGGLNEASNIRFFKLTRIQEVEVLKEHFRFDIPSSKEIKVNNYGFKIEPQKVEVLVKDNNYFKEYVWGKNQEIIQLDEHTYKMRVEFSNRLSAQEFILTGGAHFEVLQPESLRTWIQNTANLIINNYA